jgi:two-component system response regulator QseB
MGRRIAILEDDDTLRRQLTRALASRGWEVVATATCRAFLEATAVDRFDACLVDVMLPDGDGLDAWARTRARQSPARAVAMSAAPNEAVLARASALGIGRFLAKPIDLATLVDACGRYESPNFSIR